MTIDPASEREAMDAYSAVVTSVAAQLTPRVAALRMRSGRGESAGSAVVLTGESHLVTNAHVVGSANGGTAEFADGTEAHFDVIGRDRLSDLAVVRADARCRARRSTATPTRCSSGRWSWRWATRSASPAR
jgi:S1-C subfamily serine protease